uniref:Uncharacterized protein n=1 Tax=Parascaris equorum TaxID=6256 RepID=A0A914RKY0_PAREQ
MVRHQTSKLQRSVLKSSLQLESTVFIYMSAFSARKYFGNLQMTKNLLIIESIETNAFSGLFTIGRLQLRGNSIQNISGHAFSSIVNIGEIIIENNFIAHLHTEALLSSAWRTKFRDNTLRCGCEIVWIQHIKVSNLLQLSRFSNKRPVAYLKLLR